MNAEIFNHILQDSLVVISACMGMAFFYARRNWAGVVIVGALLIRLTVGIFISSGLQYYFVLDSLRYQQNAWLLAQDWITADLYHALAGANLGGHFNLYEILLTKFFRIFGYDPLLATFFNSIFAFLTIGLIYKIQVEFVADPTESSRTLSPGLITAVLLALYPSFVMWSATNVRDPLYFLACVAFIYFFFIIFSAKSKAHSGVRILCLVGCAASFWCVRELRGYVSMLFAGALVGGLVFYQAAKFVRASVLVGAAGFTGVIAAYAYQSLFPQAAADLFDLLSQTRLSFANLGSIDDVARSSFGLDRSFNSMSDLFAFLPTGLGHYFYGPYIWEIGSWVQSLALIETFLVMALTYPSIVGVRRIYGRSRFEATILLTFVATFALGQSLVISNVGTIFRHRTLGFLLIAIFAGEGIYEIGKKNYPAFFEA